jgi:uncharacterized protein YcbK (DUF882 family)
MLASLSLSCNPIDRCSLLFFYYLGAALKRVLSHLVRASLFAAVFVAYSPLGNSAAMISPSLKWNLRLFNVHTRERIDIAYRKDGSYIPEALTKLDHYLKDRRTGDVHHYDPRVFDLLHDLEAVIARPGSEINVLCGYRSPWSNNFLRTHGHGAAVHSLHMQGMAIDIQIPGVKTASLRDAALSLHRGGVGYYPKSGFVHVDVGPVRRW